MLCCFHVGDVADARSFPGGYLLSSMVIGNRSPLKFGEYCSLLNRRNHPTSKKILYVVQPSFIQPFYIFICYNWGNCLLAYHKYLASDAISLNSSNFLFYYTS